MPKHERVMVVTGASSGIGAALARLAADEDFRLVAVARRAPRLERLVDSIRAGGGEALALPGDVTAAAMPDRIVTTALEAYGRIDVVVNNAGAGTFGLLLEQSDAEIDAQWQLNAAAPLRIARAAAGALEATHGQLVFLGSGAARVPLPRYGAYAAAKAALRASAIQLRRELRKRGISVTYVDPGLVDTEFHSSIGIVRSNEVRAADPARVARRILRGIKRRAAVVNGVPWQTAGTALGEWFGTLADPVVVARFSARRNPS
ncbi:MAG TPA: SDR family NAD(P)-dependent oxidoreductase [Candidatus Cybelea sp.]|jgi:short-subunit dehydrogenase|nr:SDR family NAD(P)-dependent oxidoreductase [Candidatus Cybelea sp.]